MWLDKKKHNTGRIVA